MSWEVTVAELPEAIKQMKIDAQTMLEEATRKAKVARDLVKAIDAYEAEIKEAS